MVLAERGHIGTDTPHWIWPRKRLGPAMNVLTNRDVSRAHGVVNKMKYASFFNDHAIRVPVKKSFLMVQSFWQMLAALWLKRCLWIL